VLVWAVFSFVITELDSNEATAVLFLNNKIQCHAAEFLHSIVSRSSDAIDRDILWRFQEMALHKLLYCIMQGRLDLQTKLLSLLHSVMPLLARNSNTQPRPSSSSMISTDRRSLLIDSSANDSHDRKGVV
jgi:hypothetical protein